MGAIEDWFDYDLMRHAARQLTGHTFLLVGPTRGNQWRELAEIPNIRFLGPRPYQEVGGYVKWADVAIIPFRRTPLVEDVSPIKLFEYLATGTPVVATEWKELKSIDPPCRLISSREDFVNAVAEESVNPSFSRVDMVSFAKALKSLDVEEVVAAASRELAHLFQARRAKVSLIGPAMAGVLLDAPASSDTPSHPSTPT